jgi:SAM-dependent methyltransferase
VTIYTDQFFEGIDANSKRSAQRIVPLVRDLVHPESVLDIGSGTGAWLSQWIAEGVTDVLGVDGAYVDARHLAIPVENFKRADLSQELDLGRKYHLVSTLEVAEHLFESSAETFIETLVRHGDTILFSAAVPGQGGVHHVNEQWPSYWAALFRTHGYEPFDVLRTNVWEDESVEFWYRQNLLIFATPEAAVRHQLPLPSTGPLDLVHPRLLDVYRERTPAQALRLQARAALADSPVGPSLKALRDVLRRW